MSTLRALRTSTVGRKLLMAVSGGLLVAFVILHMAGNLKAFQGAEKFNHYAAFLREVGSPMVPPMGVLWAARFGLLAAVVVHIWSAWTLTVESRAARRTSYRIHKSQVHVYASRTMRWGGVIVAAFIVYHLMHMTMGWVHPGFVHGDAYANLVSGLSVWWVALAYVVAVTALCLHLQHGIWSAFQTLGVSNTERPGVGRRLSTALAAVVWAGYLSLPVSIMLGIIR